MLMKSHYFFLTSLPALPSLGEAPPASLGEFYSRACDEPAVGLAAAAVLLEHDLLGLQSVLSGESDRVDGVVLSAAQVAGTEPLPAFLRPQEQAPGSRVSGEDAMWEAYFRHVVSVGERIGCEFLRRWAGFEVALRNALVVARAKALNLTADEYLVAVELADTSADVAGIVTRWAGAPDPLAATRVLDQGRWAWLAAHGEWFSFRIDEAGAYARGLVLLHRWRRMSAD